MRVAHSGVVLSCSTCVIYTAVNRGVSDNSGYFRKYFHFFGYFRNNISMFIIISKMFVLIF